MGVECILFDTHFFMIKLELKLKLVQMDKVVIHFGHSDHIQQATPKQINHIRRLFERNNDIDTFYKYITRNGVGKPEYWINKQNASILIDALEHGRKLIFIDDTKFINTS